MYFYNDKVKFINYMTGSLELVNDDFNKLLSTVGFLKYEDFPRSVSIVSYNDGDSKTNAALKLACAIAQIGKTVLYVDMDISTIDNDFGVQQLFGISNCLDLDRIYIEDFIQSTKFENLKYMPVGTNRHTIAKNIMSPKFDKFLSKAYELYQVVLIETPVFKHFSEALFISVKTEFTLIIAKEMATKYSDLSILKEELEKSKVKNYGLALDIVKKRKK